MAVSWTLLFVLFDFGWPARPHKAAPANSKIAVLASAMRERSLSRAPALPDEYSGVQRSVSRQNAGRGIPGMNFSPAPYGGTARSGRKDTVSREEKMNVTMKGRVAAVTGGSKGIGLAVARRFAESGAKVAILA